MLPRYTETATAPLLPTIPPMPVATVEESTAISKTVRKIRGYQSMLHITVNIVFSLDNDKLGLPLTRSSIGFQINTAI